jgi:L-lactate dehydrogenase complex protein LldG
MAQRKGVQGEHTWILAQHLLVLLDPGRIVGNLYHAYRERAQFDARYGVFMTGASATADIEGVLIHGARGSAR